MRPEMRSTTNNSLYVSKKKFIACVTVLSIVIEASQFQKADRHTLTETHTQTHRDRYETWRERCSSETTIFMFHVMISL